jgi:hypothetical protein
MKFERLKVLLFFPLVFAVACGGGGMTSTSNSSLTLSLANSTAQVFTGQPAVSVTANLARSGTTGSVTLAVSGLPAGASDTIQSPAAGNSGSIAITAGTAAPGTYPVTVTASDGVVSGTAALSLMVGATAQIANTPTGPFSVAMSTSFQPAEWDSAFFTLNPSATTTLGNLQPTHIRLQGVSQGVPQTSATTWDFSVLDAITQPVLSVGDHSPEFQIAKAPPFMYSGGDSNNAFLDLTFAQFAGYTQNLLQYYNVLGGFNAADGNHASPSGLPITWWGIYNEPNINNSLTAQQYTDMYNAVVPQMLAVDPSIKFAALELADFSGQEEAWVPTFVSGVTAPVYVMATHFYSSCNQRDPDTQIFSTIPGFVTDVQLFYSHMAANPAFANVPVWVTENNVNADYDAGNGMSACNPGQTFVTDARGSSAFFAAWRPYVFSQLGKAGVKALYHWDFGADAQFGEVDYNSGALQISYWVDYWLGRLFPTTAAANLLQYTATDDAELETLPVLSSDGSVVIMIANHAVNSAADNNGPGAPRSILIDISALGAFTSGSLMTIDQNTSASTGPAPAAVTPASQITVTLNGYGVAFLTLKP